MGRSRQGFPVLRGGRLSRILTLLAFFLKEHNVSQLVIPDIDEGTLKRLRERAIHHAQSVEVEAKAILASALQSPDFSDPWAAINVMRENLARSGREFPDSTPLLREDRDR